LRLAGRVAYIERKEKLYNILVKIGTNCFGNVFTENGMILELILKIRGVSLCIEVNCTKAVQWIASVNIVTGLRLQ
jgi:hypothetical protein